MLKRESQFFSFSDLISADWSRLLTSISFHIFQPAANCKTKLNNIDEPRSLVAQERPNCKTQVTFVQAGSNLGLNQGSSPLLSFANKLPTLSSSKTIQATPMIGLNNSSSSFSDLSERTKPHARPGMRELCRPRELLVGCRTCPRHDHSGPRWAQFWTFDFFNWFHSDFLVLSRDLHEHDLVK